MKIARGARGALVQTLQRALGGIGVDGDFGPATERAVRAAQAARSRLVTGEADEATWRAVTGEAFPILFDRCLALTAAFEGHGYGKAAGNFDGAGVTWGIIGFNFKSGSLPRVFGCISAADIDAAFGSLAQELRRGLALSASLRRVRSATGATWMTSDQLEWAAALSTEREDGSKVLPPAWDAAFARLGEMPSAQVAQRAVVESSYWTPSQRLLETAPFLSSPRASALFFDAHVQQGGVREGAVQAAAAAWKAQQSETAALIALADTQALYASSRWREDVRSRRRCVAAGTGRVHGRDYDLAAWGLM